MTSGRSEDTVSQDLSRSDDGGASVAGAPLQQAPALDLATMERAARRMARKSWDDDDSQAFDDAWTPVACLALLARLGALEATPWRPIEEAPRDGTPILVTRPTRFASEEGWHVVRWEVDGGLGSGWWMIHDGKNDHPLRGPDPTAWQPLPPPPEGV